MHLEITKAHSKEKLVLNEMVNHKESPRKKHYTSPSTTLNRVGIDDGNGERRRYIIKAIMTTLSNLSKKCSKASRS